MYNKLTKIEKEIVPFIIQGHSSYSICSWFNINLSYYYAIKKSIFKKLHATKITQLLTILLKNGQNIEDL